MHQPNHRANYTTPQKRIKTLKHTHTHTRRSKAAVDRLLPRCDEPQTSSRRPFQSRSFLRGGKKKKTFCCFKSFCLFRFLPLPTDSHPSTAPRLGSPSSVTRRRPEAVTVGGYRFEPSRRRPTVVCSDEGRHRRPRSSPGIY